MKTLFSAILFLVFPLTITAHGQNDDLIDLTRVKITTRDSVPEQVSPVIVSSSFSTHFRDARLVPFKVELLSLNKISYALGEQLVYEAQIENITQDTIVIPCSLNLDEVKPDQEVDPPGFLRATIHLVVKDSVLGEQVVASKVLYGSLLVPSSLKILLPGQRVKVRASGHLYFTDDRVALQMSKKLKESSQLLELSVSFSFIGNAAERYLPANAENGLPFELRSPRYSPR